MEAPGVPGEPQTRLRPAGHFLGSIKQLHERVTQECAEYRALYEKMVLPPDVGPRVDWARVLEQKQVRGHPAAIRGRHRAAFRQGLMCLWGSFSHGPAEALMTSPGPLWACRRTFWEPGDQVAPPTVLCRAALLARNGELLSL